MAGPQAQMSLAPRGNLPRFAHVPLTTFQERQPERPRVLSGCLQDSLQESQLGQAWCLETLRLLKQEWGTCSGSVWVAAVGWATRGEVPPLPQPAGPGSRTSSCHHTTGS